MTPKLTAVDAAFFQIESHDTPMHVAGLQVFSMPPNAGPDFVRELVAHLRSPRQLSAPWNLRLKSPALARLKPAWIIDNDVDLDYHVRHLALPRPGGELELGVLVSRLHSHRLNRRRPLWECHVIEGLENNRFALYTKIHHALVDGVTTMRLMMEALSEDAHASLPAPWALRSEKRPGEKREARPEPRPSLTQELRAGAAAMREVAAAAGRIVKSARRGDQQLFMPFTAPHSVLNARVTGQRRLATQQLDLARAKAVARSAGVTLNDVVLALSGAALRRFLKDANLLPKKSLVAAVPVSVRPAGDAGAGNAVSMMFAHMGTDLADPRARLEAVHDASTQAKAHLQKLAPKAQALYTSLLLAPMVGQIVTGLAGRTRPYFNVTVSNVPGPGQARYFNGARLEAMYPVSIATHGQAVNITVTSYAGTLNFGFVGCPVALPHLQRLAVYTGEALAELEAAFGTGGHIDHAQSPPVSRQTALAA